MISKSQLDQYSKELDAEIKSAEESIRSLQAKLADLRKRKAAVSYLALPDQQRSAGGVNGNPHSVSPSSWPTSTQARQQTVGGGGREQTSYTGFDKPLLDSLVALGGKGSFDEVLQDMKSKIGPRLKPGDFDAVSTGEERWRNTARWRRNALVKLGFLRTDSRRGIWEISEAGRAWLKTAS